MKIWIAVTVLMVASPSTAGSLVYEGSEGLGDGEHIVFIANDHEYRSEQTCPVLAKIMAKHHGFRCTVLFGLNEKGEIEGGASDVPGLEALKDANMLFFFTRFMNLPDEQTGLLVDYFERGGPTVGVRTSTHCFNGQQGKWEKLNFNYSGDDYRGGLGEQVFGNTWNKQRGQSHYGSNHNMGSRITPVASAAGHPILAGVKQIHAYSGAYISQPPSDAVPLLEVQVLNTFGPSDQINTANPIVNAGWTRDSYVAPSGAKKNARIVYASFGASEDLLSEGGRRFLINACIWAGGWEDRITADLDVSIVGGFAPSPYSSGAYYYEGVKPADLANWDGRIMPATATLAGLGDPETARQRANALKHRPKLKAQLAQKYPELYGPPPSSLQQSRGRERSNLGTSFPQRELKAGRDPDSQDILLTTRGVFLNITMTEETKQMKSSLQCLLKKQRFLLAVAILLPLSAAQAGHDWPNIIFIMADDQGFGDVSALNPESRIPTPNIDRIANEGMTFSDGHSSSSVCTPTRYSVLTGRYHWRTHLQKGVLGGFSKPLISPGRLTVASLLKRHGYATACIGKWHLGWDWPLKSGGTANDGGDFSNGFQDGWDVDYTGKIQNGPCDLGFDSFFGISASLDMPPYVYVRDRTPTEPATVEKAFHRKGPAAAGFEAVDVLPTITLEAVRFINNHARAASPFFLYFPLNAPHTPIVPAGQWQGKSGINEYGDFTMQVDWTVGQVLKAIDDNRIAEETLVIFTTDNGCSPAANIPELEAAGHDQNYIYRGHKADIFEGGHRVPFVARWQGKVEAGSRADQLVGQLDLLATAAEIVGATVEENGGEDSVSFLPVLLGQATGPKRTSIVSQSIGGQFAIRDGDWKLCLCPGSGGWSDPRPGRSDTSKMPPMQLYNLAHDPGEENNLQAKHPDRVARMQDMLRQIIDNGRSTSGPRLENDTTIVMIKPIAKPQAKPKKKLSVSTTSTTTTEPPTRTSLEHSRMHAPGSGLRLDSLTRVVYVSPSISKSAATGRAGSLRKAPKRGSRRIQ